MATSCKEAIASVYEPDENLTFRLKGRDSLRGLPRAQQITSVEIAEAISDITTTILNAIIDVLEDTSPELLGDIQMDGVTLTGGLAQLKGIKELVEKETGVTVHIAKDPADCVVSGCFKATRFIEEAETQRSTLNPLMTVY